MKKQKKKNNGHIHFEFNGKIMRSSWEVQTARLMSIEGIKWEYEPKRFYFDNGTSYLPDFYLPDIDEWIEVKGKLTTRDLYRMKDFTSTGKILHILRLGEYSKLMRGELSMKEYLSLDYCLM